MSETKQCRDCQGTFPIETFPTGGRAAHGKPEYRSRCWPCHRVHRARLEPPGRKLELRRAAVLAELGAALAAVNDPRGVHPYRRTCWICSAVEIVRCTAERVALEQRAGLVCPVCRNVSLEWERERDLTQRSSMVSAYISPERVLKPWRT